MPKKLSKKKYAKRRYGKRRYYKTKRRFLRTLDLTRTQMVTHKYAEKVSLDVGANGAISSYWYAANNLYDPNITGVGHQPSTFDTMTTLFNNYIVIGSRISVKCISGSVVSQMYIAITKDQDDSVISTDPIALIEQKRLGLKYKHLKGDGTVTNVINTWSIKKDARISRVFDCQVDFQGSASSNSIKQWYYGIHAGDPMQSDLDALNMIVEISYTALWFNPIPLAQS